MTFIKNDDNYPDGLSQEIYDQLVRKIQAEVMQKMQVVVAFNISEELKLSSDEQVLWEEYHAIPHDVERIIQYFLQNQNYF